MVIGGLVFSIGLVILGIIGASGVPFVYSVNLIPEILAGCAMAFGVAIIIVRYVKLTRSVRAVPASEALPTDLDGNQVKLVGIAKAYPKIAIHDIAEKLGLSELGAEGLLVGLVARGIIKGRVDPGTKEFISSMVHAGESRAAEIKIVQCPYCNAALNTSIVKGASIKCSACGQLISVS